MATMFVSYSSLSVVERLWALDVKVMLGPQDSPVLKAGHPVSCLTFFVVTLCLLCSVCLFGMGVWVVLASFLSTTRSMLYIFFM